MAQRARVVKPSRRHLLAGIPRAQWDALHPGPIAQRIKPNAVDAEGVRYQLNDADPILHPKDEKKLHTAQIRAWVRVPSADQKRHKCLLCPGAKHRPENEACTRLSRSARAKRGVLYSFPSGEPLPGAWTRTRILVPPRYKSGTCTFAWRAS